MRLIRVLPGAALAAVLAACGSDNHAAPILPSGPTANLQVIHAVADAPPVAVLVDGVLAIPSLDYGQGTGEQVFAAGAHTVEVKALTPAGAVTLVGPVSVTLAADTDTVVVAEGAVASASAQRYVHELNSVPTGKTQLQVLHAAPGVPKVDVYVTAPGAALASSVPLGSLSDAGALGPTLVAAGSAEVRLTPAGNTSTVLYDSGAITLPDGGDLVLAAVTNTLAGSAPVYLAAVAADGELARFADAASPSPVRFVNASPDSPALAVIANGATASPVVPSLAYATPTAYLPLPSGAYTFTLAAAATPATTLASAADTLRPGRSHTYYAVGPSGGLALAATFDDTRRYATQARIRIVNAAPSAAKVDVYLTATGAGIASATPVTAALPFTQDTGQMDSAAGSYDLTLTVAGSKSVLLGPVSVTLANHGLYTGVVRDASGGGSPLGLLRLDDL